MQTDIEDQIKEVNPQNSISATRIKPEEEVYSRRNIYIEVIGSFDYPSVHKSNYHNVRKAHSTLQNILMYYNQLKDPEKTGLIKYRAMTVLVDKLEPKQFKVIQANNYTIKITRLS